jgi:hypothetical protein
VKRRELERHLRAHGAEPLREGARHSVWARAEGVSLSAAERLDQRSIMNLMFTTKFTVHDVYDVYDSDLAPLWIPERLSVEIRVDGSDSSGLFVRRLPVGGSSRVKLL